MDPMAQAVVLLAKKGGGGAAKAAHWRLYFGPGSESLNGMLLHWKGADEPLELPKDGDKDDWGKDTSKTVEWSGQRPMVIHLRGGRYPVKWEQEDVLKAPGKRVMPVQDAFIAKWKREH